nr:hypothetical protein [uncultured Rhodoferax sp.]
MTKRNIPMQFHRFMRAASFLSELAPLSAFRGEYMGTGLLESLEAAGLLHPQIRIRYPDAIARRFWLETHEHLQSQLKFPLEPDGERWDAAVDFSNALFRWSNYTVYGLSPHPLDDPDPRFGEFIQQPRDFPFERRIDRRVDVSGDVYAALFDDCNVEDYYSTWQVLFAAEVADSGVHIRLNLADKDISHITHESLDRGQIPDGASYSFNLLPVHAARDFEKHNQALDAVVWFAEERWRVLSTITANHDGGRYRLSSSESDQYDQASQDLASAAVDRFGIGTEELIALIRFLAKYWSEWDRDGRPRIADAYKEFLGQAILLTRRVENLTFADLRDRIGQVDGRFKPILDVIWPNWAEEEKERALLTLKAAMRSEKPVDSEITDANIKAFLNFLAENGLEAFFWRLNSFENHALRGNEFALEGMKSDVQGMAIVVEHITVALGGTGAQLLDKFKKIWRVNHEVLNIIKSDAVAPLARKAEMAQDWPELKDRIYALRDMPGGQIAADLVMAQRIRGGAHAGLSEDDHFAIEELFIGLMRAALYTFEVVRCNDSTVIAT